MAKKKAEEKEKDDKGLSEREKMLNLALKQIEKDYGEGAIMKLGENQKMNIAGYTSIILIVATTITFGMYLAINFLP